jgi:hypothetical protein
VTDESGRFLDDEQVGVFVDDVEHGKLLTTKDTNNTKFFRHGLTRMDTNFLTQRREDARNAKTFLSANCANER